MKYKVLIFDADDTLFDYSKAESFALKSAFNHFNFKKMEKRKWKFIFTSIKTNLNINEAIDTIYDLL